jgi:hypothetical protein
MYPCAVIQLKVTPQTVYGFLHAAVILSIDLFRLDPAPPSLDKDVIEGPSTAIHADEHPTLQPSLSKGPARELCPVIGVEDCRLCPYQSALEG